jgi:hypothetical protein
MSPFSAFESQLTYIFKIYTFWAVPALLEEKAPNYYYFFVFKVIPMFKATAFWGWFTAKGAVVGYIGFM